MDKNTAVFGICRDRWHAEQAVDGLRAAGFRNSDVSVLLPDHVETKDFTQEKRARVPEGATTGATSGGVIGGALGWLAGIGALAIPGVGPFIAAGPIMGALAGVGAGGTVGGLIGALVEMGIPEDEAKRYEGRVRAGGVLLSVQCDDSNWEKRSKGILKDTGAQNVSSTREAGAGDAATGKPRPPQSRSMASGREYRDMDETDTDIGHDD